MIILRLIKKKLYAFKQAIDLNLVDTNKIRLSDKFKLSDDGSKYFIGYKDDNIIRLLYIILPQMSGFIKYFDNGGKNIFFVIEDNNVLFKHSDIWNKIKEIKGIKFHSNPVYDEKYIKTKVIEHNSVIKTNFLDNEVPKEGVHYTCIVCINIDSVMKMDKKIIHKFI